MSDLMAWSADATRLPYRMHAQYLRRLFLENDLAEGRHLVDGRPVALSDIRVPAFVVSTLWDHVAPWRSVHKFHLLSDADLTFVVTSGGHNVGIVDPPDAQRRSFQQGRRPGRWPLCRPRQLDRGQSGPAGLLVAGLVHLARRAILASGSAAFPGAAAKGYPPLADAPGQYVLGE